MAVGHLPHLAIRTGPSNSPASPNSGLISPVTPRQDKDSSDSSNILPSPATSKSSREDDPSCVDAATINTPLKYTEDLEVQRDYEGHPVEFGRGVWSVVYKASSRSVSALSSPTVMITPPSSPKPTPTKHLLAVKSPARGDALPVLDAEALALTRVSQAPGSEFHVVPFHGYIPHEHAIVMSAVPLSLSTYIEDVAAVAHKNTSTKTMFDPVQGLPQWKSLAKKLITGLAWLHNEPHVVHGDIKPHNFLLRPLSTPDWEDSKRSDETAHDEFPFDPLFADFSSADFSSADIIDGPSSLSAEKSSTSAYLTALTPPFAAPEHLCKSTLASPDLRPTPASDVFSLAVTLLAAATGDLLLYPGASNLQRLAMARDGHLVIEFARSGPHGSRVPRNGVVERILRPAVVRDPEQRVTAKEWLRLVEDLN